jgi:hypothetical protein
MPKIPTYTAQGRPTTEVGGIRSNIKLDPTRTIASALLPAAKAIDDYHIKQRDNNEKLEARKTFYEMKAESDKIIESYKNNSDEFASVNGYNGEFDSYKNQRLSQIKNKRVKKRLELLLAEDQAENVYKIKKNSFDAFEANETQTYNDGQNILANEYSLATNQDLKNIKLNKMLELAAEHGDIHQKGEAWLKEETNKIKANAELFEVDSALARNDFATATNILRGSKSIDNEDVEKRIISIQKKSVEYNETNFYVGKILQGENPFIGVTPKNTTEKKVLEATDNLLQSKATELKLNEQETFAYVDRAYSETGILSPTYKDLFESAYNAGSTTTFDSPADIPEEIKLAVKSAEIADRTGRLNVYANDEQERFFRNVIVLKKIKGLDDFQAIKQAKEFEMNYDKDIIRGGNRQRNRTLELIEQEFKEIKATNIGEVKGYANKLFNMYVANGISPFKAQKQVVEDLKNSIEKIDNHAYLKRDIDAFKSIGGLDQIKPVKEYIIKTKLTDENPDDYYLKHMGGGLFEIRREVDLSTVNDDNGQPLIFYPKDLSNIVKQAETEQRTIKKEEVKKLQTLKQESAKEFATSVGFEVEGS